MVVATAAAAMATVATMMVMAEMMTAPAAATTGTTAKTAAKMAVVMRVAVTRTAMAVRRRQQQWQWRRHWTVAMTKAGTNIGAVVTAVAAGSSGRRRVERSQDDGEGSNVEVDTNECKVNTNK
jgi:hypothetical protein